MVKRGKLKSALEIFIRILTRFKDKSVQEKLKSIIEYLHKYVEEDIPSKKSKRKKSEKKSEKKSDKKTDKKPKDFDSALQEISEDLAETLAKDLNRLEKTLDELPDQLAIQVGPKSEQPPAIPSDSKSQVTPTDNQSSKANIQTVVYSGGGKTGQKPNEPTLPIQNDPSQGGGNTHPQTPENPINLEDTGQSTPQVPSSQTENPQVPSQQVQPPTPPYQPPYPINQDSTTPASYKQQTPPLNEVPPQDYGQRYLGVNPVTAPLNRDDLFQTPPIYQPEQSKEEIPPIGQTGSQQPASDVVTPAQDGATQSTGQIPSTGKGRSQKSLKARAEEYVAAKQSEQISIPEGDIITEGLRETPDVSISQGLNSLELFSKLYESSEWQTFKNTPLTERRGGIERRVQKKKVKQEKRSGEERRKRDLLKIRDEFIEKWKENSKQENPELTNLDQSLILSNLLSGMGSGGAGSSDAEDLEQINLPDPISKKMPPQDPVDQNLVTKDESLHERDDIHKSVQHLEPANEEYSKELGDKGLLKIDLPDPSTLRYDGFEDAPKRNISAALLGDGGGGGGAATGGDGGLPKDGEVILKAKEADGEELTEAELDKLTPPAIIYPTVLDEKIHELFTIELPDPVDHAKGEQPKLPNFGDDIDLPEIETDETTELDIPQIEPEPEPERVIHGILELKPPEVDDAPFLTLTYDFSKIPHSFRLSKNYSIMEYSYFKYKPMLMKAQEFARRKMLKNALNYYRVIQSQNIPPELKRMINRNIMDITEFLEKFLMRGGVG